MTFYRRRLPHLYEMDQPVFLTWRLYGTLPRTRVFPKSVADSGKAFAALDRLLDAIGTGPVYLGHPGIAQMIIEVMYHSENVLGQHTVHAFAVMPNHVHLLTSPHIPLPRLTKTLKGYTAKRANAILARTGNPFWQEESYDHLVRGAAEGERIQSYIEGNPVRAGLVREASDYPWSSAGWGRK